MLKNRFCWALVFGFLCWIPSAAQTAKQPTVIKVFAVLQKSVETKTSALGDDVVFVMLNDVIADSLVVIPKGSRVFGHIGGVATKGKDEPKSVLAIRLDKAVNERGQEIILQAIIAAISAPPEELTSDPAYAMMHSNEPKMIGSGARDAANSGSLPASSKANSNAAVATAEIKGRMDQALRLTEDSQGAVGYEDISISWQLAFPPPLTVFTSKAKNLKLEAGTQVLIRMASPRIAK